MKPINKNAFSKISSVILIAVLCFYSCKKEKLNGTENQNKPPVSRAGADQIIALPDNFTTLDGSNSGDVDNNIVGYQWNKISGGNCIIADPSSRVTQVTNLVQGVYKFELVVTDSRNAVDRDTVSIIVDHFLLFENLNWIHDASNNKYSMESPLLTNYQLNNVKDVELGVRTPFGDVFNPVSINGTALQNFYYTIQNGKVVIYEYCTSPDCAFAFYYYVLNKMIVRFN